MTCITCGKRWKTPNVLLEQNYPRNYRISLWKTSDISKVLLLPIIWGTKMYVHRCRILFSTCSWTVPLASLKCCSKVKTSNFTIILGVFLTLSTQQRVRGSGQHHFAFLQIFHGPAGRLPVLPEQRALIKWKMGQVIPSRKTQFFF